MAPSTDVRGGSGGRRVSKWPPFLFYYGRLSLSKKKTETEWNIWWWKYFSVLWFFIKLKFGSFYFEERSSYFQLCFILLFLVSLFSQNNRCLSKNISIGHIVSGQGFFLYYKFIWLFYKEKNNSRDFRHSIGSWIPLCMSSVRWPLGMKATRVVLFFSIYSFFLSESWKCVYKIKIRYALTCTGLTTIANRQEKWIGFVRTVTAGVITFSVTVLEHLPCTNFSHEP